MQESYIDPCSAGVAGPLSPRDARARRAHGLAGRLIREPFVHFVILGATVFVVGQSLEQRARVTRITITSQQIGNLADNYRLQYGDAPSSPQLEALVENLIQAEILYREALKLGLDADDEIIRRRLVQKYEFLQQDLAIPTEPTDAQLRDYYHRHSDRYHRAPSVTFTHVYLSPDRRGEEGAREAAQALAAHLNRQGRSRAVEQGDRFPGPSDVAALSGEELARVFGRQGLAEVIFDIESKRWSAPLRSGFGWHTVYVSAHQPARPVTFEAARAAVRRDYLEAEQARRRAAAFAKLREGYVISRE